MNMYKVLKWRWLIWRWVEMYSFGLIVLGGEWSCMEDSSVEKNGFKNFCVRGIF